MPDAEDKNQRRERRDRRREKPQRDNQNNQSKRNSESKPNGEGKQKADKKPEKEKAQSNHKKSEVIPECNLKLEKREVSAGEDMSFDFVTTLIANAGLSASATLYSCDDGTRRITIEGEDAATLIGHHGDTLDAIQYLANLASAKKNVNGERDKSRVTIDIEGYRAKREETLRALARRMAAKAIRNKRSVMLEPMSAYERRIIHSEIQGIEGVSTNSIGSDNNRKIVIFLTDKKPKEIFEEQENEVVETVASEVVEEIAEVAEESEKTENE